MGNVNESYHSLDKWSRVCLKVAGLLTASILYMSIQSLALIRWASGLSPGRPLKMGGGIFTQGGGAGPPGPEAGNPAAAACIATTICANRAAPAGGAPGGLMGPAGPSRGGSGGGTGPPRPPPLPPGGPSAAIMNTQCSGGLNLTLEVNSGLIYIQASLPLIQAPWSLVCFCRLIYCKQPWSLAIAILRGSLEHFIPSGPIA